MQGQERQETDADTDIALLAERYGGARGLLSILQDIQAEYNYLPRPLLGKVAAELELDLSHIYRLATFFKALSVKPRGKHLIRVCLGTACYLRGGPQLVESIRHAIGVRPGETTSDTLFTLETVNCLGACALAPVLMVDDRYYRQVTPDRVGRILDAYREGVSDSNAGD